MNKLPTIPPVPEDIEVAASREDLVVFIGGGVSRIIGCPSWEDFALHHLNYLYEEKQLINYRVYTHLESLDPRKLLSICWAILKERDQKPPPSKSLLKASGRLQQKYPVYESLYSMNAIYITTNYDDHLDEVALRSIRSEQTTNGTSPDQPSTARVPPAESQIVYDRNDLLVSKLTNGRVIHLHGSIEDEGSLVITVQDYMSLYEKDSKPAILLEEVFNRTVLFVGYGLEEYEILEFMITKSSKAARGELKHFMLYPVFEEEDDLRGLHEKYYADLGIKLIPYPIGKHGHEHLATVLRRWAEVIGSKSKPKQFLEKIQLIDEVTNE